MNRESARRTRQRKQEQTVSLKAEVRAACNMQLNMNLACAPTRTMHCVVHNTNDCAYRQIESALVPLTQAASRPCGCNSSVLADVYVMQVASLQHQNVCVNEQLKSVSHKNQELTAERQKLHEQNHMLIKCVAELSAVCKRKETTLEELRHCIQTADKLTDNFLPSMEQVTNIACNNA